MSKGKEAVAAAICEGRPERIKPGFFLVFSRYSDSASRIIIIGVALALAWWTWGTWGDLQIDCGRELYVPMEVLRGKLLYRDVWYPYGPLTPYLEAGLIWIFGQHLTAFYVFGLAITIGCGIQLYRIGAMLGWPMVGLTAALGLLIQGFTPWLMNLIFPYSYAAIIGLFLGLLCARLTLAHILYRGQCELFVASATAGIALLCKPEIGQACYCMLVWAIVGEALIRGSVRTLGRAVLTFLPGMVIPVAVYGWFFWKLSIKLVLENWIGPPGPYFLAREGPYFYANLGFRFNGVEFVILATGAALSFVAWYVFGRMLPGRAGRLSLGLAVGLQIALARLIPPLKTGLSTVPIQLLGIARSVLFFPKGMFLIALGFSLYSLYRFSKSPQEVRLLAIGTFGLFTIVCALRVYAEIVPFGYAIYYAPPLFLMFLIAIAEALEYKGAGRQDSRVNLMMLAEMIMLLFILFPGQSTRSEKFNTTWGDMYTTPADAKVATQILQFMLKQKQQAQAVVLLPEAPIFYAFTGMEAPDRWYTFQPGFRSADQEGDYIVDLKRADPKYILLTDRSFKEYGTPHFGIDFDQIVYRWILSNYHVVDHFGLFRRDESPGLAALVYERNGS